MPTEPAPVTLAQVVHCAVETKGHPPVEVAAWLRERSVQV